MSEKPTYEELEQRIQELEQVEHKRKLAEEALRKSGAQFTESNQLLAVVLEHTHMMSVFLDPRFNFIWVNRAYAETCRHEPSFFPGKNHFDLYPHQENQAIFQLVVDTGEPYFVAAKPFEFHDQPERGVTYWDWSMFPVKDGTGKVTGLVFTLVEVTERIRAEMALREGEEFLRQVIDTSPNCIFVKDWDGKYILVNETIAKLYDTSKEQMVGKTDLELSGMDRLSREEAERFLADDREVISKQQSKLITEELFTLADGTTKVFQTVKVHLTTSLAPTCMLGVAMDITKRKQAEKALQESEERLKTMVDSIMAGVLVVDVETRTIVDANPAAIKIIGAPKEQVIGRECHKYICPAEKGQCPIIDFGQNMDNSERTLIKANGEEVPVLKTVASIMLDGKECLLDSFIELTEKKRLETQLRQAQKMEAIGTLAGGIAHDFNNILGAIIGLSELAMMEVEEGSSLHRHIEKVLASGMRAKDLVKQILAFSRQSAQEFIPVSAYPIVNEALKLLRSSIPTTIEIKHYIKKDPGLILGDPTQIHQVLMNLCSNAEHAMREKGGILEVKLGRVDVDGAMAALHHDLNPGPYMRLEVKDTGYGMDRETMNHIFDPYFTTKGVGEGTGLGLAVVHGIVHKHGGAVTVESEVGKGTTFQVFFPVIDEEMGEIREQEKAQSLLPTGKERILFIDDEEVLAYAGKGILERLGYSVTTRTSSLEALELFKAKPGHFDLVITDMSMPNMTGEQLSRELMKVRQDIPIILCTGFSHIISREKALEIGIKAFTMKPLVIKDLADTVRHVLDQKNATEA